MSENAESGEGPQGVGGENVRGKGGLLPSEYREREQAEEKKKRENWTKEGAAEYNPPQSPEELQAIKDKIASKNSKEGGDGDTQPTKLRTGNEAIPFGAKDEGEKKEREKKHTFEQIQEELRRIAKDPSIDPNGDREIELKSQRQPILDEASEKHILDRVKSFMTQVRDIAPTDYKRAQQSLEDVDVRGLERAAETLDGWNPKFEGIITEYIEISKISYKLAMMNVQGDGGRDVAKKMDREVKVRSWNTVPLGFIEVSAAEYLDSFQNVQGSQADSGLADILRQQLGFQKEQLDLARKSAPPSPEKQRDALFEHEAHCGGVIEINELTGNTWEGLSDDEREVWELRLALMNARAKKQAANLESFTDNPEIMGMSKESLEKITNHLRTAEAIAMYTVFISDPDFSEKIKGFLGMTTTRMFSVDVLKRGFKDRLKTRFLGKTDYEKKQGVADEKQLSRFRDEFRGYLSRQFRISADDARTSEQIAYNFICMTNLTEEVDRSGSPRLGTVIHEGLRDMMHPKIKMFDAIETKDRWPQNVLGQWAMFNRNRLLANPKKIPLVEDLFPSFLNWKDAQGKGTDKKRGGTLGWYLTDQGKKLLTNNISKTHIDWIKNPIEAPFGRYMATQIGRASLVYGTLLSGEPPRGKTGESLQNAFRSLKTVDRRMREVIIFLMENKDRNFLNPRKKKFKPAEGRFYMMGFWSYVNTNYPGFFG